MPRFAGTNMINLTTKEELRKLLAENKHVFVDFYTPTCVPCKILLPVLELLSKDPRFAGAVFAKFDASNPDEVAEWYVRSVPHVIGFYDGKIIRHSIGLAPQKRLEDMFEFVLSYIHDPHGNDCSV